MNVVCTENAHNKSLIYSGTEALSKPTIVVEVLELAKVLLPMHCMEH